MIILFHLSPSGTKKYDKKNNANQLYDKGLTMNC